jgi:hypothetical protein
MGSSLMAFIILRENLFLKYTKEGKKSFPRRNERKDFLIKVLNINSAL